jgi:hypothetical protein
MDAGPHSTRPRTFDAVLRAAVRDLSEHGYDSAERVANWVAQIRAAARNHRHRPGEMEARLRAALNAIYVRLVERGGLVRLHPGVARFTIEKLRPAMRAELDRRILASADLIRLNRESAIEKTLQRFSGWATSIPAGGSRATDKVAEAKLVRKSLAQLPFVERRVLIDQGHKLAASISHVVAMGGGAIAGVWHSHFRQPGYDYREPHKNIDGQLFTVRGNWALEKGLMKPSPNGYTDEIEQPAELPFCRCYYQWVYHLSALPADMLTVRGRAALEGLNRKDAA